jgi:hypothetical protein
VHLQSFLVNSFFYDSYIDSNDYLKPNKQNIRSDSITLTNKGYCATLYVGHKLSSTDRDKGWLFQDRDVTSAVKIVSYIPDAVPNTKAELGFNLLYDIILYADHTNTTTYLKYSKIQDVLANLGGVIQICNVVWTIFFTITNYFDLSFDLYSYTYLDNNKFLITTYSNIETPQFEGNSGRELNGPIIYSRKQNISDFGTEKKPEPKPRQIKMVFQTGCCRYLMTRICCGDKKDLEKMKIIHRKVKKELEISSYLRLKEDMFMLKSILFTKDEWKIFSPKLDFSDVCRVIKNSAPGCDGFEDYLIHSYKPELIPKYTNMNILNEQVRRLKEKFHNVEKLTTSNKKLMLSENMFIKA